MTENDSEKEWKQNFEFFFPDYSKTKIGKITYKELGTVMRALGKQMTKEQLNQMINETDPSIKDELNHDEFVNLMTKKLKTGGTEEEDYIEAFKTFDRDGNGLITQDDLKIIMLSLGEKVSDEDIKVIIESVDGSKLSGINYQDFLKMMLDK